MVPHKDDLSDGLRAIGLGFPDTIEWLEVLRELHPSLRLKPGCCLCRQGSKEGLLTPPAASRRKTTLNPSSDALIIFLSSSEVIRSCTAAVEWSRHGHASAMLPVVMSKAIVRSREIHFKLILLGLKVLLMMKQRQVTGLRQPCSGAVNGDGALHELQPYSAYGALTLLISSELFIC